jgi:hypothetical protein
MWITGGNQSNRYDIVGHTSFRRNDDGEFSRVYRLCRLWSGAGERHPRLEYVLSRHHDRIWPARVF